MVGAKIKGNNEKSGSSFIYPKTADSKTEDKELIIKALNEEIDRRDRIIAELKKENMLLLRISLKRSESLEEIKKQMKEKK